MRALVLTLAMSAMSAAPALAQQVDAAFASCAGCHSLTKGKNGIGPSLYGVVGAKKAAAPGYAYSRRAEGSRRDLDRNGARHLPDQSPPAPCPARKCRWASRTRPSAPR